MCGAGLMVVMHVQPFFACKTKKFADTDIIMCSMFGDGIQISCELVKVIRFL